MVILSHDLRFRIEQFQAVLEPLGKRVAEPVVLAKNVEFMLFFPDLTVVIGKASSNLIGRESTMKCVTSEILSGLNIVGCAGRVQGDYLVFVRYLIDDLHDMAAVGTPEDLDFFLENHPLGDLLCLVHLAHRIGLDHLHELLFPVNKNSPRLLISCATEVTVLQ